MSKLIHELKKLKVVKRGGFLLKSGQVSNLYIDMKKAFGSPKALNLICNEMCKVINIKATCVAGSGHGGLPIATAVSLKLGLPLVLIRDKIKEHGIQKMIDGYIPIKKDRVVIVDDVFTSGTCISNMVEILTKTNAKILGGYVILSRGISNKSRTPIKSLLIIDALTK